MAVQQLGKKQAKKEKKNQKALDDEFERDEEKALEDTQRMLDLMEKIYKDANDIIVNKSRAGCGIHSLRLSLVSAYHVHSCRGTQHWAAAIAVVRRTGVVWAWVLMHL